MDTVPGKPTWTPQTEFTPPGLSYLTTVDVDASITIGNTVDGQRKVVPIRGGRVSGPGLSGEVLDAGADFQQYPSGTGD